MDYQHLIVNGGNRLNGQLNLPGSLAETIYFMSLALMSPNTHRLSNIPSAGAIGAVSRILETFGCHCTEVRRHFMDIDSRHVTPAKLDFLTTINCPASLLMLFPSLYRFGQAALWLPDLPGCPEWFFQQLFFIFKQFGVKVTFSGGYLELKAKSIKRAPQLVIPQQNELLAIIALQGAVLASGETILDNIPKSAAFTAMVGALRKMGALIETPAADKIICQGINQLGQLEIASGGDLMQLLFIYFATLITKGRVTINAISPAYKIYLENLSAAIGAVVRSDNDDLTIYGDELEMPEMLFIESPQAVIVLPALLLLGMQQVKNFQMVSSQLADFIPALKPLSRLGLSFSFADNTLALKAGAGLGRTEILATDPLSAAWLLLGTLGCNGKSIIYNGTILDQLFTTLDAQLTRLAAQITRLEG